MYVVVVVVVVIVVVVVEVVVVVVVVAAAAVVVVVVMFMTQQTKVEFCLSSYSEEHCQPSELYCRMLPVMALQGGKSELKDDRQTVPSTYKLDELNDNRVLFSKSSGKKVI